MPAAQYPNLVGDPYAGQNSFQWLNPAAFQRPQDGSYGNLGRNALRLPGVRNVDVNAREELQLHGNREAARSAARSSTCSIIPRSGASTPDSAVTTPAAASPPARRISAKRTTIAMPELFSWLSDSASDPGGYPKPTNPAASRQRGFLLRCRPDPSHHLPGAYPKVMVTEKLRAGSSVRMSPAAGALLAVDAGATPTMLWEFARLLMPNRNLVPRSHESPLTV